MLVEVCFSIEEKKDRAMRISLIDESSAIYTAEKLELASFMAIQWEGEYEDDDGSSEGYYSDGYTLSEYNRHELDESVYYSDEQNDYREFDIYAEEECENYSNDAGDDDYANDLHDHPYLEDPIFRLEVCTDIFTICACCFYRIEMSTQSESTSFRIAQHSKEQHTLSHRPHLSHFHLSCFVHNFMTADTLIHGIDMLPTADQATAQDIINEA
jgi:hypothetical protein